MVTTADPSWKLMEDLYVVVDSMDAAGFAAKFTSEGRLDFGNADTVKGPQEIEKMIERVFAKLGGVKHEVVGLWRVDDVIFCDLRVTYTRKDGSSVTLPAATLSVMDGDQFASYRVYVDMAPLAA